MKKLTTFLLVFVLIFTTVNFTYAEKTDQAATFSTPASGIGTLPDLVADSAVLIDATTGQVLYNKQMHKQKYPASTTKMITGLLAIENCAMDEPVVIDREVSFTEGSRIYLLEGEEVVVKELLYALFLESANDAALAFAKHMGGTVEEFADIMNKRAIEAGALNTQFMNPNGLPNEKHLTTAYDLAMIAKSAMKNDTFRNIVTTTRYKMAATNLQPARIFNNSNRLLWDTRTKFNYNGEIITAKFEGATGIKTGYTVAAGSCLVASAIRDGREVIGVVMQSDPNNLFFDMNKLFDYGFESYENVYVADLGEVLGTVKVKKGTIKKINAVVNEDIGISLPAGSDTSLVSREINLSKEVTAPIEKGQALGELSAYYDGQLYYTVDIVADETVEVNTLEKRIKPFLPILKKLKVAAIILLALLISYITIVLVINAKYKKKKRLQQKRRLEKEIQSNKKQI